VRVKCEVSDVFVRIFTRPCEVFCSIAQFPPAAGCIPLRAERLRTSLDVWTGLHSTRAPRLPRPRLGRKSSGFSESRKYERPETVPSGARAAAQNELRFDDRYDFRCGISSDFGPKHCWRGSWAAEVGRAIGPPFFVPKGSNKFRNSRGGVGCAPGGHTLR
jgi:hypothetical protein